MLSYLGLHALVQDIQSQGEQAAKGEKRTKKRKKQKMGIIAFRLGGVAALVLLRDACAPQQSESLKMARPDVSVEIIGCCWKVL